VGRPAVIEQRIERFGLRLAVGKDIEIINPENDPRYRDYWTDYWHLAERKGVSQDRAKQEMRQSSTLIAAMMVHRGEADGMLCGITGMYAQHRVYVDQVIGLRRGVKTYAAMNAVMLPNRTVFIADTYVNADPTAEQLAEITMLASEEMRRFGIVPKVALLSHSSFGTSDNPQARKMRAALGLINAMDPELEVEGEMHGDAALSETVRMNMFPNSRLKGDANLLIMPTIDAANISFNLLKAAAGGGVTLGPILLGVAKPVHILTPSATVRRTVNMTALTVVDCTQRQPQLL
jgi:malate dehydrogenase (oxaloacetate-decarboxylating)(NADP+)